MRTGDDFSKFKDAYSIGAEKLAAISLRCRRITRQLNADFWNSVSDADHGLYVGSYGRDTAAAGVTEVDVAFVLPGELHQQYAGQQGSGPSALLQRVKASVQVIYATSEKFDNGQAIAVGFKDGVTFKVTPVFETAKGSAWIHPIEGEGRCWRVCNPRAEMVAINRRDKATNGNLKCLSRMMRVWRETHKVPMSGLLIDTLAFQFIADFPHRNMSSWFHDCMVRDFFLYLSEQDSSRKNWRVPGSGSAVARTGLFEPKAREAYRMSVQAIRHSGPGQTLLRRRKWREIFGPLFPLA